MKKLLYKLKSPCNRCPYKLGYIKTFVNPCPQCKSDNYRAFEEFVKQDIKGKQNEDGR